MEQDSQKAFTPSLGTVDFGYDPLAVTKADEEDFDNLNGQAGPYTDVQAKSFYASPPKGRSAIERTQDLFAAMAPRRRVLLALLRYVEVPRQSDLFDQKVEELQKYDSSVYSGYDYSQLLREAGAIQKINKDGTSYIEDEEQPPDIVEIDGTAFFKPAEVKEVFWSITDDGLAYLEADDSYSDLKDLLAEQLHYCVIYKRILEFCSNEAGRSAGELSDLIDKDPLVQKPRRFFSYFVKKLEDSGALVWKETWKTTELGRRGLELLLSGVEETKPEELQDASTRKE